MWDGASQKFFFASSVRRAANQRSTTVEAQGAIGAERNTDCDDSGSSRRSPGFSVEGNHMNRLSESGRFSSGRIAGRSTRVTAGRLIWFVVGGAVAAAAACVAAANLFCSNCSSTASTHCTSLGRIVCNYSCNTGICGGFNPECNFNCCVPPPPPPPVQQQVPVENQTTEAGH